MKKIFLLILFFLFNFIFLDFILADETLTECNSSLDCSSGFVCTGGYCTPDGSSENNFSPVEVDLKDKGYAGGGLSSVISGVIKLIFLVATLAAFAFLIFGGVEWITSGGDSSKIQSARNRIMQAIIGLLVLASTWENMNFVVGLLGQDSFEETVKNTPSLKE